MARRHEPRRGVVLLIVLILLTLLMVIGLTFVVISGQFRRGADAAARTERYGMPPEKLLDRAMYQLVRDTSDTRSVLWGHSLLRDLYGVDRIQKSVRQVTNGDQILPVRVEGELIELQINDDSNLNPTEGYYSGRVLTFLSGLARGISVRIVNSFPTVSRRRNRGISTIGWLWKCPSGQHSSRARQR